MTSEEMMIYRRQSFVQQKREAAFGDSTMLYGFNFENDNGSVSKMADVHSYVDHWSDMQDQNIGLLLWGSPGTGKTFAAGCVANALCEQLVDVRMLTLGTMLTQFAGLSLPDKASYLSDLQGCDLLIVDDFGVERRTDYAQEQVYGLINGRYLAMKPMIVTTNLSLNALKSPETITEQRIYDRVLEMCVPICFTGTNLRQAIGKGKFQLFKELN